ncbi:hypothetical protein EDB80DRAFT_582247 [Ilyonectria destructans]|nr:hypothetical protein EDB80DRAFT_582247 [Ilyonectria destructans]
MPQDILLPQCLLPITSIRLGRFIVRVDDPHLSPFHDPKIEVKPDSGISESTFLNYDGDQHASSGNKFAAGLPSLLNGSVTRKTGRSCAVSADSVTIRQLTNPVAQFKEAVKDDAARKWFEERKDEGCGDFYFVVGYYVMVNAVIEISEEKSSGTSGQLNVPVSAALAAGGILLPDGGITDPKFEAGYEKSQGGTVRFKAPGDRISALQYRKVSFKWLSSKNLDKATLGKNSVWESLLRVKGEAEEEEEDMAQVELEEDEEEGDKAV